MLRLLPQLTGGRLVVGLPKPAAAGGAAAAVLPANGRHLEQRRFARNTKPWSTGKHDDLKKGVIAYDYRRKRAQKVARVELPDFVALHEESRGQRLTPDEMRSKLKEQGIRPHRAWDERPLYVGTSNTVIEPYEPPEGDGRISIISKEVRRLG